MLSDFDKEYLPILATRILKQEKDIESLKSYQAKEMASALGETVTNLTAQHKEELDFQRNLFIGVLLAFVIFALGAVTGALYAFLPNYLTATIDLKVKDTVKEYIATNTEKPALRLRPIKRQ